MATSYIFPNLLKLHIFDQSQHADMGHDFIKTKLNVRTNLEIMWGMWSTVVQTLRDHYYIL